MANGNGSPTTSDIEEEKHKEFLLAALRSGCLRAKLVDAELTRIGVALKAGMIGADTAVAWVREEGLLWFVGAIPEEVGRVAKANPQIENRAGDEQ